MRTSLAKDQRRGRRGTVQSRKRRRQRLQPALLALEDRRLLSTFTVTSTADPATLTAGTLRYAIAEANAATSPSAIELELGSGPATITLLQGQLELSNASNATTIYEGPGQGGVTISGNNASRVFQVDSGVTASISGLTITGGSTSGDGAGLDNSGGTLTLTGCTISGNSGIGFLAQGGGINNQGGTVALTNCTVNGNFAAVGGGIRDAGTLTLDDCTVSGNSVSLEGGGIRKSSGMATLTDTIVAGNSAFSSFPDVFGSFASLGNNLIGKTNGSSGWVSSDLTGTVASPLNPVLAPLGNYGGPTPTMAELPGSPAIGAGNIALIPSGVTTDQRGAGFPRIVNNVVDIGAFESSGFTIAATSGGGQTAEGFVFPNPLVATVTANNTNEPVAGGLVTFTPPASGASAMIIGSPAVIGASGTASVTAENNGFAGSYIVSATANGASGTAYFGLTNTPPVSIALSPSNPSLALGVTGQFNATGTFSDGSTEDITKSVTTWASATPSVATISGTGLASALALGTSSITASWQGVTSPGDTLTVIAPRFVVNTTADAFGFYCGTTSLREAIAGANDVPGQTITFDKTVFETPQTIDLTGSQLELSDTSGKKTITGPTAGVTLSAGGNSRVFQVDSGVTASVSGLTITGGSASNGGGLANYGGNLTLTNCTLSGDSASYGGGVASTGGGTLTLTNCTVSGNTASGAPARTGGGVDVTYGAMAMLSNCTIAGNYASFSSGGVNIFHAAATLTDCTISGNSTGGGGGGLGTSSGTLTLTNCTVSGNSAYGDGGGGVADFGVVSLTNCTVSGNYAYGTGGGLENYGTATLGNTIVAGNTANTSGPDVYGAVTSPGHNLIGETDGSSGWVGSDLTGTIATPLQPLLAPLDSYGGPTETMALLPGSPAIDAGSNALVPGGVTTDQRGYARIGHGTVDIGAFEVQPIPLLVNTTAEGGGCPPGMLDLSGAIGLINITPGAATISFAPTIFAGHQTITLSASQLELSNTTGTETIIGPAAGVTVSGNNASRVFQVDAGVTASITGLTITDGNSGGGSGGGVLNYGTLSLTNCTVSGNSASGGNGGGVANDTGAALSMMNCTVRDNTATYSSGGTGYGGGVYNEGIATLTHCTVSGNSASGAFDGGGGGGLANGKSFGDYNGSATTTLYRCAISHNSASGSGGGVVNYGATTLNDCTISGNSAGSEGGGVRNGGAVFGDLPLGFVSTATLINCTISGNTAGSGGGVATEGDIFTLDGGPQLKGYAATNLSNCRVSGNSVTGSGGGLFTSFLGTTTATNTAVSRNSAASGGGLYTGGFAYDGNNYGTTILSNCTVSGNSATGNGGGLDNYTLGSTALTGTSVSGNSAVAGGGIFNQATLHVASSTISNNQALGGAGGNGIGGGILSNGGSVALSSSTVMVNTAKGGAGASGDAGGDGIGGGLALENNATATVNNTLFLRNLAQGGAGGAGANGGNGIGGAIAVAIGNVFGNSDTSSLAMTAGLVTGNFAQGGRAGSGAKGGNAWGGGARVGADGSASFDQSDILLNEALSGLFGNGEGIGGGLYVATGAVVTLHKSTVAQNLASTSNNIYGTVIYE